MTPYRTDEVFGMGRNLPLNYVEHPSVDERFVENLTRDKHVVIYGSSKQGKTSLRKHYLDSDDYVTVTCSNRWGLTDVHSAILKNAGFEVLQSSTVTASGAHRLQATFHVGVPGVVSADLGGAGDSGAEMKDVFHPLEIDPTDVNDIIHASMTSTSRSSSSLRTSTTYRSRPNVTLPSRLRRFTRTRHTVS